MIRKNVCWYAAASALSLGLSSAAAAQSGSTPTPDVPAGSTPAPAPESSSPSPVAANSGSQLQEIVVTAQKRSENLQKVPLSVVAIGGPALEARGITKIADLAGSISGFQTQVFAGALLPYLRGVGSSGTAISGESSVAVYTDGIFYARLPSGFFNLKNVERVEVLKGPQGTLFGRNSTAGVINIITKDPSFDPHVEGSIGYGRFKAFDGDLYATAGLSEKVAMDISVSGHTDDGFGRDITSNQRYGFEDDALVRSKLLFQPDDDTKFVLAGFYNYTLASGQKAAFPGTATGTLFPPAQVFRTEQFGYYNAIDNYRNQHKFKIWGVSLHAQHDLPFAQLKSITGYSHLDENDHFDGDYGPHDDQRVPIKGRVKLFTQELQIASLPGSPLNWIGGFYYYNNATAYYDTKFLYSQPGPFGPGVTGASAPAQQKSISYAGFAQATYEIVPRLKLTGGIRYTHDKTSASGHLTIIQPPIPGLDLAPPPSSKSQNRVTFKASMDYQVTDNVLAYVLFSRGYKNGNYNILTYNSTIPNKNEGLDDYEGGIKTDLLNHRLRINFSGFHYKISNPQVQLIKDSTVFYSNALGSRVNGAEIDATALFARGLTGRLAATYLDSKYTAYGTPGCNDPSNPCAPTSIPDQVNGGALPAPDINATGNRTPLAAKLSFNIGGDYKFDTGIGAVTLTADFYHNSGFFYEPDNFLHQKAYNLLSSQVMIAPTENLAVRFWGKNLLDKKYTIAAATQIGSAGYPWTPAPPRTFGVAVDFSF